MIVAADPAPALAQAGEPPQAAESGVSDGAAGTVPANVAATGRSGSVLGGS